MSQWLLDTFTDTPGKNIIATGVGAHVSDVGNASWTANSGFGAIFDNTGGRIYGQTTNGTSITPSVAATTDNESVELTFDVATVQGLTFSTRGNANFSNNYGVIINANGTSLQFYRTAASSYQPLGAAKAISLLATGNILRLKTSGTGASVTIEATLNGTVWTEVDSSASRIVVPGKTALSFNAGPSGSAAGSDTTGIHVTSISGMDTAVAGDTISPTASAAVVTNTNPTNVAITMSESLATDFVPDASCFNIAGHTVSAVNLNGPTVNLTSDAFVYGEAARNVTYTKPTSNGLRDAAGNQTLTFTIAITNNVAAPAGDTTPPAFVSAQVSNNTPNEITITMSEVLSGSPPPASAFPLSDRTVTGVTYSGNLIKLALNLPYKNGDVITVPYNQPATDPRIKDAAGNVTLSFSAKPVTNNVAVRSFTADTCASAGTIRKNQMSYWTWFPRGQVGVKMDNPIHGSTMLPANGKLVVSGIIDGPGLLMQRFEDGTPLPGIYYESGVAV